MKYNFDDAIDNDTLKTATITNIYNTINRCCNAICNDKDAVASIDDFNESQTILELIASIEGLLPQNDEENEDY